jgi:hypothetical protein
VVEGFYIMQHLPNRQVVVAGHVQDENPAGASVMFSGVATGQTTVNESGQFQATLSVSQLGQITAVARDSAGLLSAPVSLTVSNVAPVITSFTATEGANRLWTFSGTVSDEAAAGLAVTFASAISALNGLTVTVSANGTFSVTVQLTTSDYGSVAATLTDWWGEESNEVCVYVSPTNLGGGMGGGIGGGGGGFPGGGFGGGL